MVVYLNDYPIFVPIITNKTNKMKELIETLKQIDSDFYKGIYTVGERYDLVKELNEVLKRKHFINQ